MINFSMGNRAIELFFVSFGNENYMAAVYDILIIFLTL